MKLISSLALALAMATTGAPTWAAKHDQQGVRQPAGAASAPAAKAMPGKSSVWNVLYHAQRRSGLAVTGPYALIRHPQYVAFVLIVLGFLLQWPTLLTLVMFPILLVMYARPAITEEAEMRKQFGAEFETYAARTPRFVPSLRKEKSTH